MASPRTTRKHQPRKSGRPIRNQNNFEFAATRSVSNTFGTQAWERNGTEAPSPSSSVACTVTPRISFATAAHLRRCCATCGSIAHRTAACDDKALRATGGQPQKTRKTARTSRGTLTASCPSSRARSARSGHPPVVLRPGGLAGGARRRSAHGARPCNDRRVARSSGMQAHAHAHARHPSTVPPRRAPDHGTARADAPGEGHADFHAVRTRCHGPPRHHAEAPPSCAGKRQGLRASRRCGPGRARR